VVLCVQMDQIMQLSAFIDAEVDYHRQSVDVLQRLLESLKERSVTPVFRQNRERHNFK